MNYILYKLYIIYNIYYLNFILYELYIMKTIYYKNYIFYELYIMWYKKIKFIRTH